MSTRLITLACAVGWAYAATAAVLTRELSLVGPCAVGFVACVFVAQLLQVPVPFDGQGVDGFEHDADLFPPH